MKKGKGRNLLPNSLRIISSCIKTVSTNASTAVRSAGATVAASISSSSSDDRKEQVLWAGFDKLELSPAAFRRVLLLGYMKGFQVFDVEDASGLSELISRRDGPVTFLQMLPSPVNSDAAETCRSSHPILVVVGGNEGERTTLSQNMGHGTGRYGSVESSPGSLFDPPTAVRFYSMKVNEYVKVIDFKSAIYMVRCSPRVVAIGLEEQVYCFDSLTLEKKFTVVTYPLHREQGAFGVSPGYGPMAVGPRWLAYPPNRPFFLNTGRVSPKSLASSVSPSTSPGGGTLMARYAMESSKHLAAGILTIGDMGYKKLSKYCPELLPDGSNSPGWKAGKLATSEQDNAGVIVVKDVVSMEIISQFKAHASPISALCFDPSGTLLVTASVHGNNFNIFRIMPSHCSGSSSGDWSNSYVHLYKLHRGITNAVIEDICFSRYSQWVAFVSAKGTCHIYVLSPFGGDSGFQAQRSHGQSNSLILAPSKPWWSTSSFAINEQNSSPPPPCTLSVVTRIKCSDSGLLNSVSNAASSMVGKMWVPSGAFAAIFHNSNSTGSLDVHSSGSPLEHILVYTPSGFVVQHEIHSSDGHESNENRTESWSASQVNPLNEEFKIKVEPIQWWDVCRRVDNLEREECISGSIFDGQNDPDIDDDARKISLENSSPGEKKLSKSDSLKSQDRSHWYLSNAEVQINSCRLPIWQNPKIHFHVMEPPNEKCYLGGEFEIERASAHEVEIRHKDLLPVFNNPSARSGWNDRYIPSEVRSSSAPSDGHSAKEKGNEASVLCHSKPPSFSSTESSEGGSSRRIENLLDLDHMNIDRSPINVGRCASDLNVDTLRASLTDQRHRPTTTITATPLTSGPQTRGVNLVVQDTATMSRSCPSGNMIPSPIVANTDSAPNTLVPLENKKTLDFGQFFKEGYCNKPEFIDQRRSTEVVTDEVDNCDNNPDEEDEKPDEEGWMGGMFDFSEEG